MCMYAGRLLRKSTYWQIQTHRSINRAQGLKSFPTETKAKVLYFLVFALMFYRGVKWGPLRILSAEHRHASETEGNPHLHSKGKPVISTHSAHLHKEDTCLQTASLNCLFLSQSEDSSTHEKLDFKLHFTCTSYLITTPCYRSGVSRYFWVKLSLAFFSVRLARFNWTDLICTNSDAYAKLLESGDLKSSSLKLEGVNMPFHHLLARICFHHHFSGSCRGNNCCLSYLISVHYICSVDITDKRFILKILKDLLNACRYENIFKSHSKQKQLIWNLWFSKPFMYYPKLSLVWNSCGEDRLLCLFVQQVNPGSPCLFAGQNRKFWGPRFLFFIACLLGYWRGTTVNVAYYSWLVNKSTCLRNVLKCSRRPVHLRNNVKSYVLICREREAQTKTPACSKQKNDTLKDSYCICGITA